MSLNRTHEKPGVWQPIVGYHLDEEEDWVAELGCLHFQHVRHKAPWINRDWVLSDAGRQSKLGRLLKCVKCYDNAPADHGGSGEKHAFRIPSALTSHKLTRVITQDAVPKCLLREHQTARGVWALLHVLSGSLKYCISGKEHEACYDITPDAPRVIPEEQPHFIIVTGAVSFQLEFFGKPGVERETEFTTGKPNCEVE